MRTSIVRSSLARLALGIILFICLTATHTREDSETSSVSQPISPKREASLIESVGLHEFAAETNNKAPSPVEKAIAEEIMPVFKTMGDGSKTEQNTKAISELAKVIAAHPHYPDAYFLRATLSVTVGDRDYHNILADINRAIQLKAEGQSPSAYESVNVMYAFRGRVHFLFGHPADCISDLEKAVTMDVQNANEVISTGDVKPEDNTNPTSMQKADYDALIAQYPKDYRVYMLRGLFYGSFLGEQYYFPAFEDLKKASQLNPKSALVKYFLGRITNKTTFLTEAAARDISDITGEKGGFKERTYSTALSYFKAAAELDPAFIPAHAQIAESLYSLKRYSEAIPYYDKVIELDPMNAPAYNDRGLSKTFTGNYNEAIRDFSKAIELKTLSSLENTYENRADAHVKLGEYDKAIADYGAAIGLSLRNLVFLMSVAQIRSMYPEFSHISDQDLLEGLRQKYFPNMSPEDFRGNYAKKDKPFDEFVIAGVYEKRGDAYLAHGHFREAIGEYSRERCICNFMPSDNWRAFRKNANTEFLIDTTTIDLQGKINPSVWIREVSPKSGAYNQENYEFDCVNQKFRLLEVMSYDSHGNQRNSSGKQNWQPIDPKTIGEILYRGLCR
jgi:tetratricopeptide (TPR) repeat protein